MSLASFVLFPFICNSSLLRLLHFTYLNQMTSLLGSDSFLAMGFNLRHFFRPQKPVLLSGLVPCHERWGPLHLPGICQSRESGFPALLAETVLGSQVLSREKRYGMTMPGIFGRTKLSPAAQLLSSGFSREPGDSQE